MVVDFAASAAAVLDGSAPSEHYIGLGIAALVLLASCWNIITGLSVMHLPGPPKLPIFGNALSVMKEPWNQFARWHKQYGDIYTFGVWTLNMVAVCDADAIKTILRTKASNFQKDDWTYDTFRPILGRGLVTTKGAKWQKHRRMLKPAFHFDALRRLHPVFTSAAERLCRKWSGLSAERNAVELGLTFRTVTLEVISEVAVGLGPDEAGVLPVLFESVLDELNQRVMQPWRRFMWTEAEHQSKLKQLNELVFAIIAQRRAERKSRSSLGDKAAAPADTRRIAAALGGDMLDMMLQADEEAVAENKGPALTDEELADELKTMLLAGHETTSMMLLWSCYLLARHPDKFKVAREEVDAALGTYGALLSLQ
ncbi:Cyp4e1, partial [Symbiodinium sp. KB8]